MRYSRWGKREAKAKEVVWPIKSNKKWTSEKPMSADFATERSKTRVSTCAHADRTSSSSFLASFLFGNWQKKQNSLFQSTLQANERTNKNFWVLTRMMMVAVRKVIIAFSTSGILFKRHSTMISQSKLSFTFSKRTLKVMKRAHGTVLCHVCRTSLLRIRFRWQHTHIHLRSQREGALKLKFIVNRYNTHKEAQTILLSKEKDSFKTSPSLINYNYDYQSSPVNVFLLLIFWFLF